MLDQNNSTSLQYYILSYSLKCYENIRTKQFTEQHFEKFIDFFSKFLYNETCAFLKISRPNF